MPRRPIENYRKGSNYQPKSLHITSDKYHQHGSPLLDLPQESLTHVTSYLSPPSLFALARTCRYLCDHVDDDNTWLRAFLNQFLNIGPEHEFQNQPILLFQRIENTWRKEFLLRHDLRRRWERSRNPTVTHSPQDASIDGVHLMPEHGLLTSSIQYGVVARSIPLNGRVLKGYIDASGTGLGIGNPNVEFTPNVSACAMSSHGGTARVFWGKRSGEVALSIVSRVVDSRAVCKFIRCSVSDQHEGAVHQLIPNADTNTFLSAGVDGRIKLWDTKALLLLWFTDKQQRSLVTDPFVSIAGGLGDGFVAGALKSGDILLHDLHESEAPVDGQRIYSPHHLRISSPIHNARPQKTTRDVVSAQPQIAQMWLYRTGEMRVLLLVQYMDHPQFYHVHANVQSQDATIDPFGDSSFGNISVLEPVISMPSRELNMLIVGDQLGFVSIYDPSVPLQTPVHRFEAHTDGAVTAISWSPTVFATGSARGTTAVWDSLTLEPVRYFTFPAPRSAPGNDWDVVRRIILDKELVVIVVGNRVMTWKVGPADSRGHQPKKARHANTKRTRHHVTTKGHEKYEMSKDIAESRMELEYERARTQRMHGCEREQRSTLDTLGLSELEAVEYALMLSREEEAVHQQQTTLEGVFEGEFDDLPSTPTSSLSTNPHGRRYPRVSIPVSNEKVQVSPPLVPEPNEAGTSISPLKSLAIKPRMSPGALTSRSTSSSSLDHFPAINSSPSSKSSSKRGTSASPKQPRSVWSTPLKLSPTSSSPRSRVVTPTRSANASFSANIPRREASQEMDDDLRLAIQLSLAEA